MCSHMTSAQSLSKSGVGTQTHAFGEAIRSFPRHACDLYMQDLEVKPFSNHAFIQADILSAVG